MPGLSHITFIVSDLDRMERFFVVGDHAHDGSGSSPVWIAIMQGEPLSSRSYNHLAFKIAEAEYESRLAAIHALGLHVRESRPRVEGEGRSIYFHDHDNHLFELHTGTLAERLKRHAIGHPDEDKLLDHVAF
jgi:fosfomycin resistance protein FosX